MLSKDAMMGNAYKLSIAVTWLVAIGCSALAPKVAATNAYIPVTPSKYEREETRPPAVFLTATASETPVPTPQLLFTVVEIESSHEDFAVLLRNETQKAKTLGQAPYIEVYADWCESCQALLNSMTDARMMEAYRGTYIILANIDIWKNQLYELKINVIGIPAIYELTYDGKPTGRHITGAAWGDNIPENMAPPLDAFFHPQ